MMEPLRAIALIAYVLLGLGTVFMALTVRFTVKESSWWIIGMTLAPLLLGMGTGMWVSHLAISLYLQGEAR